MEMSRSLHPDWEMMKDKCANVLKERKQRLVLSGVYDVCGWLLMVANDDDTTTR